MKKIPFLAVAWFVVGASFWALPVDAESGYCGSSVTPTQLDEVQDTLDAFTALEPSLVGFRTQGAMYPQGDMLEKYRASKAEFSKRMSIVRQAVVACAASLTQDFALLEEYDGKIRELLERKEEESREENTDPIATILDPLWHWIPTVNDPLAKEQHYIRTLGFAEDFMNVGSEPIIVAVIDDGVASDHEDLKDVMWLNQDEIPGNGVDDDGDGFIDDVYGWNFVTNSASMTPTGAHGTGSAGIIGAKVNNALGIAGVGGNVKIMPIVICDADGTCPTSSIARAIEYAITNGAKVINLSLGAQDVSVYRSDLDAVLRDAALRNVVVVAAAGNGDLNGHGLDTRIYNFSPICNGFNAYDIIGVGATDSMNVALEWSNFGGCVDTSAPGLNIEQTSNPHVTGDLYAAESGTSFASPLIAAMVARILQIDPGLSPREVRELLVSHTRLGSPYFADIAAAMRGAPPVVAPTPPAPAPPTGTSYVRDAQTAAAVTINVDKAVALQTGVSPCVSDTLIKNTSSQAVYYCGADGKRYVFPNAQTYFTWYADFDDVVTLTDTQLAQVPLGGVVTYRPGTRMLKIQSSPQVYAVAANGELRAIASEAVAKRLYGDAWNKMIDDISDAFFINYKVGASINE